MLKDPAPLFQRGAALAHGMPRTLIVLGAARGGTSMIARMLHDLGVYMGEALNSTYQDRMMNEISRGLFHGNIDINHPAIEEILRQRDSRFDIWGWKFTNHLFPQLYAKTRNPHFIVVFRDPVAIATREAISYGYNADACLERALDQISDFGRFALSTTHPCLSVSYERGLARKAELIDALVKFAGIVAPRNIRQQAARGAQQGSDQYLRDTQARDIEGRLDNVGSRIAGWLRYPHLPGKRVNFTILLDGISIHIGLANRFREDLKKAFNNDGRCAFDVPIPTRFVDGKKHKVSIVLSNQDADAIENNDLEWTIGAGN